MIVWLIVLLCTLAYIIITLWNRRGKPPGPYGLPFLGFLPFIDAGKPYETFSMLAQRYGSVYGLWMGKVYTVVLTDPNLIRSVLSQDESTGRAPLYITHGIMGGHGIICAQGALWRDQRRLSIEWLRRLGMIKFGAARLVLEKRIMDGVNELIQEIDEVIDMKSVFDPSDIIHHVLGNLMNDLVFGIKYEKNDSTWQYLQHLQAEGVKHIGVSMAVNFLPFLRHIPSTRRVIDFLLHGKSKTHMIYDLIIADARIKKDEHADYENGKGCILNSFLDEASSRQDAKRQDASFCSDIQLRHLMADLFGAGVDTTFSTIRWALLFIALHPSVQKRLREELMQGLNHHKPPSMDDIKDLPYLRATVAEVQRIRTVVPVGIPHGTTKEMTIAGYRIPSNTMIMPLLWAVHMSPTIFTEPDTFKPERFLDVQGRFAPLKSFLPFQAGKRMCLGEELARNILHLYVAHIVWHYRFEIPREEAFSIDLTGSCGITLTPPNYRMSFNKVKLHDTTQ